MTGRTVHVAVFDTLADWEVGYLAAHLRISLRLQADPDRHPVVTVGLTADPVTTTGGFRVLPDLALADVAPQDSAALVLPGGDAWTVPGSPLRPFAVAAGRWLAAGVPVAAICGATRGLAREGLLDAVTHTSNAPAFLAGPGYAGAQHYVEGPAVTDGDVVTAAGRAPVHVARELFRRLEVMPEPVLAAWFATYAPQDPHAFDRLRPG